MINREALREYASASLWVLPTFAGLLALLVGSVMSQIDLGPDSPLVFQGTADDARGLLIAISGTVVTVIALTLGLTVVALQLSSTQFSPRLLRTSSRPPKPGRAQFVRRHLHLQRGWTLHRRGGFPDPGRGVPAAGCERRNGHAVREPCGGGVLRRPPRALDPDRRDHRSGRTSKPSESSARTGLARSRPLPVGRTGQSRWRPPIRATSKMCTWNRSCRSRRDTQSPSGFDGASANTWLPGPPWCGSGVPIGTTRRRTRRTSARS